MSIDISMSKILKIGVVTSSSSRCNSLLITRRLGIQRSHTDLIYSYSWRFDYIDASSSFATHFKRVSASYRMHYGAYIIDYTLDELKLLLTDA